MKTAALFLLLLVFPARAPAAARSQIFEGAMECRGPYDQPQLGLPSDYLEIRIAWDPLFKNSDVTFRQAGKEDTGTALFYVKHSLPAGPDDPDAGQLRTYFQGAVRLRGRSIDLTVYHGLERDSDSSIDQGMMRSDGEGWYALHCRRLTGGQL